MNTQFNISHYLIEIKYKNPFYSKDEYIIRDVNSAIEYFIKLVNNANYDTCENITIYEVDNNFNKTAIFNHVCQ